MITHILNNDVPMCGGHGEGVHAASLAGRNVHPNDLCAACVIEYNRHPATKQRIDEERAYWKAHEEYFGHDAPRKTVEYQGDPAMDAMGETLDAPPFRQPTQAEVLAEIPIPTCSCQQARYAVFIWVNPDSNEANWHVTMATPIRPIPVVTHCPFCGDRLPKLVRKNLPEGFPPECYYWTAHE